MKLLNWEFVAWALAILVGAGLAMIMVFTGFNLALGATVCFSLAAMIILAKVVELAVLSTGHSFWERGIFVFVLFGFLGVGSTELIRWIYRNRPIPPPTAATEVKPPSPALTEPAPPKVSEAPHKVLPSPLIRRKAFSTVIPFALDSFHAGIPYDSNHADPLLLTYTVLAGISDLPTSPLLDQASGKLVAPKISDANMESFLGHVMQYYILRTVNEIQNPVTYTNFESGKGISTDMSPLVSVPDEKEYPNEKLFELFEKLKLRFSHTSGPNDWMWKQFKMNVPSGTKIDFVEVIDTGRTVYIVRFERAPDLLLDFRIEPAARNRGQGTFPKNFVPVRTGEIQDAYSYVFTVHVDLQWTGERSVGQDYVEWANGLEAGLRKKLVIP